MRNITTDDQEAIYRGEHTRLYQILGAHPADEGYVFRVWAPNAFSISVIGDFNGWDDTRHWMTQTPHFGVWEVHIPEAHMGNAYKFCVRSKTVETFEKADPFAFAAEVPPKTASVLTQDNYSWNDTKWMKQRAEASLHKSPMSIYEVHLGSWKRPWDDGRRYHNYRELAPMLVEHVKDLGFTHVELMPITEFPYDGSWGYQVTGYFAATSRYGDPDELKYLIDQFHQNGIGVIVDWVPAHFPYDAHGLYRFDGTPLYEHPDPRRGDHPDWGTAIFNYGRDEVSSFLLSSAMFWFDKFHVDGLRVDAVSSMLYLDYSRNDGEWEPNAHGGRENLEAINFLKSLTSLAYRDFPGVQVIAEESTAYPGVSKPLEAGGLGFGFKWDMGWMHDHLEYFSKDPVHRKFHHKDVTFRPMYANSENFILPLSHDEVVHGKGSLFGRMAGDEWQKFANLRLLYTNMYAHPGKKLLFMGAEMGQFEEWNQEAQLDWARLQDPKAQGVYNLLKKLNQLYKEIGALHELDCDERGFRWINWDDAENSVLSFIRQGDDHNELVAVIFNLTPVARENYSLCLPRPGKWDIILNTDDVDFGGSGYLGTTEIEAAHEGHYEHHWANITLPPLGALVIRPASM
ncbi:MAG: 1,4-alpha-glucan branching protein GlgB [Myxococcota bacterium]|nr:1,4-alpha-glucan branching protein GlgB [Myxococcota bacterium]